MSRPSPDPYVHITGFWQHWTGRLLSRIPFALCGMWLGADTDTEYPGPDGPLCPTCTGQITVRQWFRLPRYERERRIAEFKNADNELQANGEAEDRAGVTEETELYHLLNGRVNDLWPTVPWWVRR